MSNTAHADLVDYVLDLMTERNIEGHIVGFNKSKRHLMVCWGEDVGCTVLPLHTANGIGRFECSTAHYRANKDTYHREYPYGSNSPDFRDLMGG